MNGGPEMDERPAQEREYTLAQAARLLETSKQTIRNHMGADPAEVTRRQVNGQPRIYITERALARIREELRRDQAGNQTEKEPQSAGILTGKLPESTEKRAGNRPETTEKDRQAQEIAWLRAQLEEKDRQLAAKDQQIAAAQQLADQAQKLQLIAERRLIAAGIDPDTDPAADPAPAPAPMEELREELEELRAQVAAAQAAQDQQKRRSFWDIFRRR